MSSSRITYSSPFLSQRRERENGEVSVYINYGDYPVWVSEKNCLIYGSRGTGKSSVLYSLDYRTKWFQPEHLEYSEQYKHQYVAEDVRNNDFIGVLFKADRMESNLWDQWYNNNQPEGSILFASYLAAFFLEQIIIALKRIIKDVYPEEVDTLRKRDLLARLFQKCHLVPTNAFYPLYSFSLDGLLSYVVEQRTSFRRMVYQGMPFSQVSRDFLLESASSGFVCDFCSIIEEELPIMRGKRFFLMIDDVDRLKTWQIKTINSFLKVASSPCSWKLSTSLPYQTMSTEDDARISGTDLKISILNDEKEIGRNTQKDRINELYEAIFKIRMRKVGVNASDINLFQLFGRINLDEAVQSVVRKTENDDLKAMYSAFIESKSKFFTDYWLESKHIVPIGAPRKMLDKYRVNAAFALVSEYKLEKTFQYSSYEIIRALCAGSPRHFLRICDAMWEAIYRSLNAKTMSMISVKDQDLAIRAASKELFDNIDRDQFDGRITSSCKDMTERLSRLFQCLTRNHESLKISQECLSVMVDLNGFKDEERKKGFIRILDKLATIEAVRIKREKNPTEIFYVGLNPMLSPYFFLPFRSPFFNYLSVDANQFYDYLTVNSGEQAILDKIVSKRLGGSYPSLF